MSFSEPVTLGHTGLSVGRMGLGAGYGAPAAAFEMAFDRGCNYFYWTSRKSGMRRIHTIVIDANTNAVASCMHNNESMQE